MDIEVVDHKVGGVWPPMGHGAFGEGDATSKINFNLSIVCNKAKIALVFFSLKQQFCTDYSFLIKF